LLFLLDHGVERVVGLHRTTRNSPPQFSQLFLHICECSTKSSRLGGGLPGILKDACSYRKFRRARIVIVKKQVIATATVKLTKNHNFTVAKLGITCEKSFPREIRNFP